MTLGVVSCKAAMSPKVAAADKPHIVFLMVDDWGWSKVGYHRNPPTKEVVSPNFDSLVKDGLELDHYYAYQFCAPSRCSLLSGRLPIHVSDRNIPIWSYNPNDTLNLGSRRNTTCNDHHTSETKICWLCHTSGWKVARWECNTRCTLHRTKISLLLWLSQLS